ncbi:MAG TPA: DUF2442 domain-containing protein [Rhizomicrobium sp.]|jgi:hypothetical protein
MAISDAQLRHAEHAMRAKMQSAARAETARFDRKRSRILVGLSSGLELAFPPELAEGLCGATPADLAQIEITPSGLGLHWPRLDADLYLPSLLEGTFGSPQWMARLLGRWGGLSRTPAKARAARKNGRLGGRPRKSAQG